jgi:hypothetical protein
MNSSVGNILNGGTIGRVGRQEGNKLKKGIDLIGEDNLRTLVEMHLNTALTHACIKVRTGCQEFLLDRFVPKPAPIPHQTYVNIELVPMESLERIKENEDRIVNHVCNGKLSLQEGERLMSMTEQTRKTYEATEMARMIQEMDQRMKESGI